jgi:hypothetical protein
MTCSSTIALPLQRTNEPAWPKTTPTIRNIWQINAAHTKRGTPSIGIAQRGRNAAYSLGSAFNWTIKKINKNKHVSFATHNKVHQYTNNEQPIMVTYDSGANGHYISEKDQCKAGLPILRPSTQKVGVANGGTSKAKCVTQLPFQQLSAQAMQAGTFQDFPTSLMSVGKTADNDTVSVFTKEGASMYSRKKTCSSHAKANPSSLELEIAMDNTESR